MTVAQNVFSFWNKEKDLNSNATHNISLPLAIKLLYFLEKAISAMYV